MQTMNDGHESELPDDKTLAGDRTLDEAFLRLRRLEPTAYGRNLNRTVITDELQQLAMAEKKPTVPWWRKTIAVPVPVAAALVMIAAVLLFSNFRKEQVYLQGKVATPTQPAQSLPTTRSAGVVARIEKTNKAKAVGYFETETYVCGVGRLKSESGWQIPKENQ
jgi:hypothetical protein